MIQLKLKTEYSFGRAFASIARLKDLGLTAAGMVDSNTWGHVAWFNACREAGIVPLLGLEVIVGDNDDLLQMWFLAKNTEGLSELYRLSSKSYQQTVKGRRGSLPRFYRQDVLNMSTNISKFAGDITDPEFLMECGAYIDFNPSSKILNAKKLHIANKYRLPMVSTSDNAYWTEADRETYELLSKGGAKVTPQYVLTGLDRQDSAQTIVDACRGLELPKAPMLNAEGDLEEMCRDGVKSKFPCAVMSASNWNENYEERVKYELDLIRSKNFESYFLIVADMVRCAKQHMLVGPSRGSAAGSLVCYLLGITEVDPIPAGLYFERFIDVNRSDLPDIDLDFPDSKRQMVFDYMEEKYGSDNVAHIGTIGKYRPKSALITIGKALGIPNKEINAFKSTIGDRSLNEAFEGSDFINEYPQAIAAARIEGHAKQTGVHAAGLLVCDEDITNFCTVDHKGIAHVEKEAAEQLGLLKIDVLGLRTLSVLEDCQVDIDWYGMKFDDPKVFDVFNSGKLCGIFQFEGNALRKVSRDVTFKSIDEVSIVTALARPGPLQSGIDKKFIERMKGAKYGSLIPSLDETYGLPIYQEQTMAIVREIGGFDWADTMAIRKAVAKSKGNEEINKYKRKFMKGVGHYNLSYDVMYGEDHHIDPKQAKAIWSMISEMGSYQMNKAHTYSYSVISYWTAYLKAYHPMEFAAANLRHPKDDDSSVDLLREGYDFVAFDSVLSQENWAVVEGKIYGGFLSLNGVGPVRAKKLVETRGNWSDKQKEFLKKASSPFFNIYPMHKLYSHIYDDPDGNGIAGEVSEISALNEGLVPHQEERVFLAEITYKGFRNEMDKDRVKKREGQWIAGPLEFVDVRLRDDSGEIGGRVGRYDFLRIGSMLPEVGAHIAVRAVFYNGIPWAFIKKWRRIDDTPTRS